MPPKQTVIHCTEIDIWNQFMNSGSNKLTVVDVYTSWCGPCEVMVPIFKNIYLLTDDADSRLQFLQIDSEKVPALKQFGGSSKPCFAFYLNGKLLPDVIRGANAPAITKFIKDHLPVKTEG
eukprot:GILI01005684.1.p1 GENE.GILI01005684.1~~GILI01005684.1.p1  ORF type:complete len:121 (-),score=27.86 GILI01005684.1:507-869(-)